MLYLNDDNLRKYIVDSGRIPSADMYQIRDNGEGENISLWLYDIPQPSESNLQNISIVLQAEKIKTRYSESMQNQLDNAVQSKGYKDGFACAGYYNSTNLQWKAEAEAFVAWRDAVWEYAHQVLDNSKPENYPTLEQFLANAPAIVWP